jgi:NAD(P)-dependent dehydrogenase (short-subunit alcohol dehydrogenase family)
MKNIVITGSTRGIGFGLAQEFLERACAIMVSGRSQGAVDAAVTTLAGKYPAERIAGKACDVRDPVQVQALWEAAVSRFGQVDIWVNNAGYSPPMAKTYEIHPAEAAAAIETNLLGTVYGTQAAAKGMLAQGSGAIYNMEGMGSDGRKHDGLALYGSTKYGLAYFNDCFFKEMQGTPVLAGALRPGMVVTDLITGQYEDRPEDFERAKRIFNLIAERVEIVTPWLAEHMLANRTNGARLSYMSTGKMLGRMATGMFKKRDLFEE